MRPQILWKVGLKFARGFLRGNLAWKQDGPGDQKSIAEAVVDRAPRGSVR